MAARVRTITQKVVVPAAPQEVYEAFVNPRIHAAFTKSPASGSMQVGGRVSAWDGYISAVNRTLVCTYTFRMRGAPEKMFLNTIAFANIVNGTGSLVLTDDLEIYNRIGLGVSSEGAEWLEIGRGFQSDLADHHGGRRGKNSTSEVYIRNMLDAWLGYMTKGRAAMRAAS